MKKIGIMLVLIFMGLLALLIGIVAVIVKAEIAIQEKIVIKPTIWLLNLFIEKSEQYEKIIDDLKE